MHGLTIVGLGKPLVEGASVAVPVGDAALGVEFYEPLLRALDRGPLDVTGLREAGGLGLADAIAALSILVAGGYAAPVVADRANRAGRDGARRLNRVLVEENRVGGDHSCLIAPVTGAAVVSEYVEMLAMGLLWDGRPAEVDALVDEVLEVLEVQGRHLREDWEIVTDPDDARRIARERVEGALARRGTLSALGIA